MQWRTVILDNNNWALATSDHKEILHWCISDKPWLTVRTFGFEDPPNQYPCQLKSITWRDAEVNRGSNPERITEIGGILMAARVKLFSELYYRLQASKENLAIDSGNDSVLLLWKYLSAKGVVEGGGTPADAVDFENRIKLLDDLDSIKNKIIKLGVAAKSKEDFDGARLEMERLFFTNILL